MPFIRSLVSKRHTHAIAVILLLGEIIPFYSCCKKKKLVYIIIITPFSCQPSSYFKCTKLNISLSYNIRSVFNAKYIFISLCNIHNLSQLLGKNT